MFHSWLMDEDLTWLADALGLVVDIGGLPTTISASRDPNRANIEIHSVRTAMKRGALGWPEQHMVVVVTQWRAGFFDKGKQKAMDQVAGRIRRSRAGFQVSRRLHAADRPGGNADPPGHPHAGERRRRGRTRPHAALSARRSDSAQRFCAASPSGSRQAPSHSRSCIPTVGVNMAKKAESCQPRNARRPRRPSEDQAKATSTSPTSPPPPSALKPPPGGAVVRMYRIGHGDCFLIAFAGEKPKSLPMC